MAVGKLVQTGTALPRATMGAWMAMRVNASLEHEGEE